MQINVLVEPINGAGFRASSGDPFRICAEAATREEALKKLQGEIDARIKSGAEIVCLEVPVENPWMKMAGIFKDDPMLDEWKQAMAEYRDQIDKDESYP